MKIAVLGGGITGLTAAFRLSQERGGEVVVFEKEAFLGGLASGFKEADWEWSLERAYHHIFACDKEILQLTRDIGFKEVLFSSPKTVSLYREGNNYRTFPVDTPQDFLFFPLLSFFEKIRAGMVVVFLKLAPHLSLFDRQTAYGFLVKTMGKRVWSVMWEQLFRKKFGKYAENIVSSFIWARLKKRTKQLGYMEGGFQRFVDLLGEKCKDQGVLFKMGVNVDEIKKEGEKFEISYRGGEGVVIKQVVDRIICTLPTPVYIKICKDILPETYKNKLRGFKYLYAINCIFESKNPVFQNEYWVSNCDPSNPVMVFVQHTNYMDKKHYGGNHILYGANYVEEESPLLSMSRDQIGEWYRREVQKIKPSFEPVRTHVFIAPFAQPICDSYFVKHIPTYQTPVSGLILANLDMTYPYDRGTNYAVLLGNMAAKLV